MKLHIKRLPVFSFNMARMFAMAALAVSALLLGPAPAHAQTSPVTLQCQVSASGTTLACTATIPGGSGVLDCQSPGAFSDNNGVITASEVTCSGTAVLAGVTVPGTLTAAFLTINTNDDTINAASGSGTLTINQGLSTLTSTCQGNALSASLSPPALTAPAGTCSFTLSELGVGTAQLIFNDGSISLIKGPALSIGSTSITLTASLLGLPLTTVTCGTTVPISLNQLPSISDLLTLCKGS